MSWLFVYRGDESAKNKTEAIQQLIHTLYKER